METYYYTIYKTKCLVNEKFYIGKHKAKNPNDSYLGSGKKIKMDIEKYGKENFKKEILFIFDNPEDMNNKEKELVDEKLLKDKKCYNIMSGGTGGNFHSSESKIKISIAMKGIIFSEERKNNISKSLKGRKLSDSHVKKLKERKITEETKKKISQSLKGEKNPRFGKKLTNEQKSKISQSLKGEKHYLFGKKQTKKFKEKISKKVKIDDIIYSSFTEAARALNVSRTTIANRIKNKENYNLI